MEHANRLMRFLILAMTVALGAHFVSSSAEAQAIPIENNLIVNGDFQNDISGWSEESHDDLGSDWSSWDANENSNSGSLWGKTRGEFEIIDANERLSRGTVAWQCVDVVPDKMYYYASEFRGFTSDSSASNKFGRLYLQDITGEACPTSDHVSHQLPFGTFLSLDYSVPLGGETNNAWEARSETFVLPSGVTRVRVGLHVKEGHFSSAIGESYDTTVRSDNITLGIARPDISVAMSVSDTQLNVGEEFEIDLGLSSQYNGFGGEIRVFHDDRLQLVGATCDEGSVIDAQQGGDHYFQWFGIAGGANSYSRSCTITARAKPGFDDVFTLFAQGWCNDCGDDIDTFDNIDSVDLAFIPAPDIGVQEVSLSDFPQPGEEMTLDIAFHNHGTKWATSNVSVDLVPMPVFHATDTGACAGFSFSGGEISGLVFASPGETVACTLRFTAQESWTAGSLVATVNTTTSLDYNANNNSRVDSTRVVDLLVNRSIEGWDGTPGDGICESASGNDDCTLRAAVMEANALAAATGRMFTVKVPYSPFSYTLSRTSGDDESLYGSLKINHRMHLVGLPDGDGNLPFVVGSFPTVDADRLISIGNPASFVRIENMHFQGQGLVPTNTDGQGTDGGLVLHQSGALVLSNVILADGMTDGSGGGLHSASDDGNGHLTLEEVRIFDNQAADGGGLTFMPESFATLSVIDSNIHGNQANAAGGGLLVWNSGGGSLPAVAVERSTLHGNAALLGGGAYLSGVFLAQINNSTVSGNIAETSGGGVSSNAATALAVNNSTIAFNEAGPGDNDSGEGGGLYVNANATATLYNSIVSGNMAKEACSTPNPSLPPICVPRAANCYGTVDSAGYNAMAGDSECSFSSAPSDDNTHVQLDPLADNGGPTPTHAPASFNWIVDAGDPACLDRPGGEPLLIDQRGAVRPADGDEDTTAQCDRGAYELSDNARVSVLVDDAALGRVQSSPNGIWCGEGTNDSCNALFSLDAEVVLTATVASGSGGEFIGWEGACAGQGATCTVTASGDVETTALFVLADQPDFLLGCVGGSIVEVPEGGTVQVSCSVQSVNGYSQPVSLLCFEGAASIDCQPSSPSVTPPVDGSQSFTLSVDAGQTPPGDYPLLIEGSDGERVRQAGLGLSVLAPVSDGLFSDRFEQ